MQEKKTLRRIASSQVYLDGQFLGQYVLEVNNGIVVNHYPLVRELPFTEWIPNPLKIETDSQGVIYLADI